MTKRNGIKQRKNSWQDGVLGTNCAIQPNSKYTYKFQTKDQIGSYTYFPSTLLHKDAGGYGGLNVYERPRIPIPFPNPDGDFTLVVGDWYKTNHKVSKMQFIYSLETITYIISLFKCIFCRWLHEPNLLLLKITSCYLAKSLIFFNHSWQCQSRP